MSWRLASFAAEPDKPRQADGAMTVVIAPDFGGEVLILRESPEFRGDGPIGDLDVGKILGS